MKLWIGVFVAWIVFKFLAFAGGQTAVLAVLALLLAVMVYRWITVKPGDLDDDPAESACAPEAMIFSTSDEKRQALADMAEPAAPRDFGSYDTPAYLRKGRTEL